MNNLQYIVKDNTRYAMHVAVELCEQGDFDTVRDALTWLALERDALIAEHMSNAIEKAKGELLESCEYVGDMGTRKNDVLKAFDKMEQAITKELNAMFIREGKGWV